MTSGSSTREAGAEDFPAVRELLRKAGLPFEDLAPAAMRDFLMIRDADGAVLAVGGFERYGEAALLRSIVVTDAARGRGLGRQLVEYLEMRARRYGIKTLYLLTTTAGEWFPRLGYLPQDRTDVPADVAHSAEFSSLCPASAVCLRKSLPTGAMA